MLVKVYTVQPLDVALALKSGIYVPMLDKSFATEHTFFRAAYECIKVVYSSQCGIPFLEGETGIWGYSSLDLIDKTKIKEDEIICEVWVDDSFLLESSFSTWEKVLDGKLSVFSSYDDLFYNKEGLQQLYFSSAVVEKVEFVNFPVFL